MLNAKKSPQKQAKTSNQPKLQKLISKDRNFEFIENGKIRCIVTGHEMLPTIQNYQNYLKSKSYKRGIEAQFDISQYEGVITPHKDSKNFLYCQLTRTKLPKKKSVIMRHVQCKKFQRRYQQYLQLRQQAEQKQEQVQDQGQDELQIDEEQADENEIDISQSQQEKEQPSLKPRKLVQGGKTKENPKHNGGPKEKGKTKENSNNKGHSNEKGKVMFQENSENNKIKNSKNNKNKGRK